MERAAALLPSAVRYHSSAFDAARGADVVIVVTEWEEFRHLDLVRLKREMATPLLVDLRNLFSEDQMTSLGFAYCGIGHRSAWHGRATIPEGSRKPVRRSPKAVRSGRQKGSIEPHSIEAAE